MSKRKSPKRKHPRSRPGGSGRTDSYPRLRAEDDPSIGVPPPTGAGAGQSQAAAGPPQPQTSTTEAPNAFVRSAGSSTETADRQSVPARTKLLRPKDRGTKPPSTVPRDAGAPQSPVQTPARGPRLAWGAGRQPLQVLESPLRFTHDLEPQSLAITYWFDAAPTGAPYPVSVRFAGRLRGPAPDGYKASFNVVGTAERVLPGSGRVALTVRVPDVPVGSTWDVTATPIVALGQGSSPRATSPTSRLPKAAASGTATFAPVAAQVSPGVRLGAWPTLVAAGAILALLVQSLLAARVGLRPSQLLPLSLLSCVLGVVGAKAYYIVTHRSEPVSLLTLGMSVQGFVLGAIGTLVAGTFWLGLPLGAVLDVTAPGLLTGMAVGRLGCLLGGCCVGRPTASRWGVWSSDRRLGLRRIPVQPIESMLAGVLAVLTGAAVLIWGRSSDGVIFLAGVGAYTAGRQLLFPLRELPRSTPYGRVVTLVVACAVSLAALLVLVVR